MIIKRIEGFTRELGKSQGYIGLPLRDEAGEISNGPDKGLIVRSMVTAWEPTPIELERLNAGAAVELRIFGTSHPPVIVEVGKIPND